MLNFEDVNDFMLENFSKVEVRSQNGGSHWHARCAICGDSKKSSSKKRFHLDWKEKIPGFNCFNCGNKGNFFELVSIIEQVSVREAKEKFLSNDYSINTLKDKFNSPNNKKSKSSPIQFDNLHDFSYILDDCISLTSSPSGYIQRKCYSILQDFVKARNLEDIDIPLYISYRGDYKFRIIIPIFYNDKLIYFQARRPFENGSIKYLNPSVEKDQIILHKNEFNSDKYIIVNEGLIDAYCIGKQATTCLGKEISDSFLDTLGKHTDYGIIVALDNDKDGIYKTLDLIYNSKWRASLKYFLIPEEYAFCKDINDLKVYIEGLYNFVVENSFSILEAYAKLKLHI